MSGHEMDPPRESLADAHEAEAAHDERDGEFRREQDADLSRALDDVVQNALKQRRASAVPARVCAILAECDLTLGEAVGEDDETLLGIPGIGPVSLDYIRSTDTAQRNRSAFVRYVRRIQRRINNLGGSGRG